MDTLVNILVSNSISQLALYVLGALVFISVLAFLSITGYLHYVHQKYSHLPQPERPSFYLGHLPDIFRAQKEAGNDELNFTVVIQQWYHQVESPTFVIFVLHSPWVFSVDPECIKTIAMQPDIPNNKDITNRIAYVMGQRFLGKGLATLVDYETWKPRRQLYDPSFTKSYLKTLLTPFNEMVDRFLEQIKPLADGTTLVPMKRHFGKFTMNVISKVAFGMESTEKLSDLSLGLKRVKSDSTLSCLTDHALKGVEKNVRYPGYQYFHPFEAEGYREVMRALRMIGKNCIKKRIGMIENDEQVPSDILTQILQLASTKESVDIEVLVDDFVTFYISGLETTSNLLTFSLVLTLQHPNVLERLVSEVSEVLGGREHVTSGDLEKLQYTEQILKEALRLYGPAIGVGKSSPPNGITLNGHYIPGETQIMLPTSVMCRLPEYFDDPDTFNPSRFDPENKRPSSFVYFPFGLGQRACIGNHFAMMEAKIAFSRLFQTYKISLPEDYELIPVTRLTVHTKDDAPCTLELLRK